MAQAEMKLLFNRMINGHICNNKNFLKFYFVAVSYNFENDFPMKKLEFFLTEFLKNPESEKVGDFHEFLFNFKAELEKYNIATGTKLVRLVCTLFGTSYKR